MSKFISWKYAIPRKNVTSMSNVAILFSANSRNFGKLTHHAAGSLGMGEMLDDSHILYDYILDNDLSNSNLMKQYKLLILPAAHCLSSKQIKAIKQYVKNGGSILATSNTSAYNELGAGKKQLKLSTLFGVTAKKKNRISLHTYTSLKLPSGETLQAKLPTVEVKPLKGTNAIAHGTLESKKEKTAAWYTTELENGSKITYIPFALGATNYEFEARYGKPYTFSLKPKFLHFLQQRVGEILDDSSFFKAIAIPRRLPIAVNHYKQNGKEIISVHLLNATGTDKIKKGMKLTVSSPIGFPKLKTPLSFRLKLKQPKAVYLVSPGFPGKKEVEMEQQGDDIVFKIKPEDIKIYSVLILEI